MSSLNAHMLNEDLHRQQVPLVDRLENIYEGQTLHSKTVQSRRVQFNDSRANSRETAALGKTRTWRSTSSIAVSRGVTNSVIGSYATGASHDARLHDENVRAFHRAVQEETGLVTGTTTIRFLQNLPVHKTIYNTISLTKFI